MLPAGADAVEPPVAAIGGRGEGGQAVWVGDGGGGGQVAVDERAWGADVLGKQRALSLIHI